MIRNSRNKLCYLTLMLSLLILACFLSGCGTSPKVQVPPMCYLGVHAIDGHITKISEYAPGFELGDKFIDAEATQAKLKWFYKDLTPGDTIKVTVERDGRPHSFDAVCLDGKNYYRLLALTFQNIPRDGDRIDTGKEVLKWKRCHRYLRQIESLSPFYKNSGTSQIKVMCGLRSERDRLSEFSIYEYWKRLMEESKYYPGYLEEQNSKFYPDLQILEQRGFASQARELKKQYLSLVNDLPVEPPELNEPHKPHEKNVPVGNAKVVATGTCFAVRADGYLATNYHVIEGASQIIVRLSNGWEGPAKLISKSPATDLAVLKIDAPTKEYLTPANRDSLYEGAPVFTMGYPVVGILGTDPKYTEGTISALSGLDGDASYLQISVPIQPGNSGGPLVDFAGQLVGVTTAAANFETFIEQTGTLPQNVNWAVNASLLSPLYSEPHKQANTSSRREAIQRVKSSICLVASMQHRSATQSRSAMQRMIDEYVLYIREKVERRWIPPPDSGSGLSCTVEVRLIPSGEVIDAQIVRSSGNASFDRSVEAAVFNASPLPVPQDPVVMEKFRTLRFEFKPG